MKVYLFGEETKPVILLLPGAWCHWQNNFKEVIPLLEQDFRVAAVSYNGFDETEKSTFTTMEKEAEDIEKYVVDNFSGKVFAAYGCSLGGRILGLLIKRGNIFVEHAILGSTDLTNKGAFAAKFYGALILPFIWRTLKRGNVSRKMQRQLARLPYDDQNYLFKYIGTFYGSGMRFVKIKSIFNQYVSDLVTNLGENISCEGTTVHVLYANQMGGDIYAHYLKTFKDPHIVDCNKKHEELLLCEPENWVETVRKCCF